MYRDSLDERRARTDARARETLQRADATLRLPYGASARRALREAMIMASHGEALSSASLDGFEQLERALDTIDARIALCEAASARMEEHAAPYEPLGRLPSSTEPLRSLASEFRDPPEWSPKVADELGREVRRWARQIRGDVLVAAQAEAVVIFFHAQDLPFRLELDAKEIPGDEISYVTETTLLGTTRPTSSAIAARPQTFGDDVRAALRIRRDLTFGDSAFDSLYFVSGPDAALREFFTTGVRAAFVQFAAEQPTSVYVDRRIATMRLETDNLNKACAFLAALAD